jgi:hypothetical protein
MTKDEKIVKWIIDNHPAQEMHEPPEDWNPETEFYYRPDLKVPIHYGPVNKKALRAFLRVDHDG